MLTENEARVYLFTQSVFCCRCRTIIFCALNGLVWYPSHKYRYKKKVRCAKAALASGLLKGILCLWSCIRLTNTQLLWLRHKALLSWEVRTAQAGQKSSKLYGMTPYDQRLWAAKRAIRSQWGVH